MNKSKLKDLSLLELGLSESLINRLNKNNILTVQDLIMLTDLDLMSISNLGQKSIDNIKARLKDKGLKLNFEGQGTPIEDLGLKLMTYNSLKRMGINSLEELKSKSEEDLMKIRGLGDKSVEEIKLKLKTLSK